MSHSLLKVVLHSKLHQDDTNILKLITTDFKKTIALREHVHVHKHTYLRIVALTVEPGSSLPHTAIYPLTSTRSLGQS
jgi:hypothetical protein